MALRRKSMLDAFRAVPPGKGAAARPGEASARPAESRHAEARPAAAAAPARVMAPGPAPARPAPMRVPSVERSQAAPMSRDRVVLLALLAVTILVVVVMIMKNGRAKDVAAGEGTADGAAPPSSSASVAPGGSAPAAIDPKPAQAVGNTAQDQAFLDAKNRFTIRVAQYDNEPNGEKLARATYKYLNTEGVPVVQPIVSPDKQHYIVCVDAKPKVDDLTVMRDWVKKMRGPAGGKKTPYSDAFIDNIDHVLRR